MADIVKTRKGKNINETIIVGDRLYTDITNDLNASGTMICVLIGEATVEEINRQEIKPTFTFADVKTIYECLQVI